VDPSCPSAITNNSILPQQPNHSFTHISTLLPCRHHTSYFFSPLSRPHPYTLF
jgi:hypothetical protein